MVDVRTNLLKNRNTLSEKDYQRERNILRMSVTAMVISVVVIVALSIWNLVLTAQQSAIDKSLTATSQEIQGLAQASAQQVYLKSRLALVTGFLANRTQARESLQKVFAMSIPGTHVAGVTFEGESGLGVQYSSNSASSLDQLLAYFQADTGYFTQAVSKGLSRSKDGSYQMTVSLTLPKGDK